MKLLHDTKSVKADDMRRKIKSEVESRLKNIKKDSTPVLKLRVTDVTSCSDISGILTIWRPGDMWSDLREGHHVHLSHVLLSYVAGHTVHLNTSKLTHCQLADDSVHSSGRILSPLTDLYQPGFQPQFNEVDIVVAVVNQQQQQNKVTVTVTDFSQICVNIVMTSTMSAVSVLQPGAVVSCRNLEWRHVSGHVTKHVPILHFTDISVISLNPREKEAQCCIQNLKEAIATNKLFFVQAKNNLAKQRLNDNMFSSPVIPIQKPIVNKESVTSINNFTPVKSMWSSRDSNSSKRLKLLDEDISSLESKGEKFLASPHLSIPCSSPAVPTPFKPPKLQTSKANCDSTSSQVNSEEMEKYALEFVEELNI